MNRTSLTIGASVLIGLATLSHADEQAAIDGCIDQIRTVTGGLGGEVLQSSFSEAGTSVTLRDSNGTVWECIGYSDGTVGDLRVNEEAGADDGEGAMAGAGGTMDERVQFDAGTSGAEFTDSLAPGASKRYILGASEGQDLYFRLAANGPGMTYVIYNPDGSVLLDEMGSEQEYRGQLWQSGDHVITVYNMGDGTQTFNVIFGID